MSRLEKQLELDVDRDVLDIATDPPRRRLVDYRPGWFVHVTRTRWGLPNITPYERWLLCLILLKTAARVYAQTAKELLAVPPENFVMTETSKAYEPEDGWN